MLYSLHEYVILLDHEDDKIIDKAIVRNMKKNCMKTPRHYGAKLHEKNL
jgi:hypothetical protein